MSETSPIVLLTPTDDVVEGSCGVTVPNSIVKVVDVTTGEALGPNQRGELCVKGPQVGSIAKQMRCKVVTPLCPLLGYERLPR
jgi:long-subunit acyl-CoA synthetase (AMP-forming)